MLGRQLVPELVAELFFTRCPRITEVIFLIAYIDPRVKEGRKSVYGITRKLQKTVFALVSQTDEKKLYVKISLKNIENDSDNFESVTNEFEYCYIIKRWKLLLSSVFADAPNYHKRKS